MITKSFLSARRGLALAAVAMVAAAACSGGSEESTIATPAETTTTAAAATTTTDATTTTVGATTTTTTIAPVVIRQPLTGEPLASEADLVERPALAVKIDNHPGARRNHSGLAVSDIVYEEKVEGSLTRFAAVLHSQDADPVGPIRSGREQDVALLSSLNEPLFAWSGGNPGVTALIRASFLVDIGAPSNSGSYYRGPGSAPHNLYSDTDSLYALTPDDHPGAPPVQFGYLDDGQVFAGEPGRNVSLSIGSIDIEWTWNDDERRYERSQEGEAHVDKTYGRIGAENVILLGVDYRQSSIDANAPEAITIGSGLVTVFSNGEYVSGTWQRKLEIYPFNLTLDNGQTIQLTPGQTWVELVEVSSAGEAPAFEVS
jgi:hypothetical protein